MISPVQKLSWHDISSLLLGAKTKIRLVLPSMHEEWAMLIEKVAQGGIKDIKICLNNSEKYMRDGFGDEKSILLLKKLAVEIVETENNRISLISADNNHFIFFPTSRTFESIHDEEITNAVLLDEVAVIGIICSFFPGDVPRMRQSLHQMLSRSHETHSQQIEKLMEGVDAGNLTVLSNPFNEEKFNVIQHNIQVNPIQSPDLKREIDVYTTKVQFVELKFENGKINGRRVKIPKHAMPFQSEELKRILESSMRIFSNQENAIEVLKNYKVIQGQEKEIRKKYLKNIRCRNDKSVIEKTTKTAFEKQVLDLNNLIQSSKDALIKDIDDQIIHSKKRLKAELIPFFTTNPPPKYKRYLKDELAEHISAYVHHLVYDVIDFPEGKELVEEMGLKYRYYDLTPADFTDDELLKEFEQKGILQSDLNSIRELKKAFEAKK